LFNKFFEQDLKIKNKSDNTNNHCRIHDYETFYKSVNFEVCFRIVVEKDNEDIAIKLIEFLSHSLHDLEIDVFGEQIKLIPPIEPTPKNESMGLTDYFQNLFGSNKNIELKLLQEENNLLKKNNEDLLFANRNLVAQLSELELKNSVNNNLSNFDEEEIEMLRGKVEGFEKLFSFYFK
jgi:hypothetical protein